MQAARKFSLRKTSFFKESLKLESVKSCIFSSRFNVSLNPICKEKNHRALGFSLAQKTLFLEGMAQCLQITNK